MINKELNASIESKIKIACDNEATPEILEALLLEPSNSIELKKAIASNKRTPQHVLDYLSDDKILRDYVCENPNCSSGTLKKLSKNRDEHLRTSIAMHPNCPSEIIKRWARSKKSFLRSYIADNPRLPNDLFHFLANDESTLVRSSIAGNQACPADLLLKMQDDKEELVLTALAKNLKTPIAVLEKLADSPSAKVRYSVAKNPACPDFLRARIISIPKCVIPNISERNNALEPFYNVLELIDQAEKIHPEHDFFCEGFAESIRLTNYVFCFKTIEIDAQYADRKRSMFEGPFFTSRRYPWPISKVEKFAAPLIQIDLTELTSLNDKDYGEGLLQVFDLGHFELYLRVIPWVEVEKDELTPIPPQDKENFYSSSDYSPWLESGIVSQVIGYKPPIFLGLPHFDADKKDPIVFHKISELLRLLGNDSCDDIFVVGDTKKNLLRHVLINIGCCKCFDWEGGNPQVFYCDNLSSDYGFSMDWGSRYHLMW